jgi:hypothetical protein
MFEILLLVFAVVAFATAKKTRERLALIERQLIALDARLTGLEARGSGPLETAEAVPETEPVLPAPQPPAVPSIEEAMAEEPAAKPLPEPTPPLQALPPQARAGRSSSARAGWSGLVASRSPSAAFSSCAIQSSAG